MASKKNGPRDIFNRTRWQQQQAKREERLMIDWAQPFLSPEPIEPVGAQAIAQFLDIEIMRVRVLILWDIYIMAIRYFDRLAEAVVYVDGYRRLGEVEQWTAYRTRRYPNEIMPYTLLAAGQITEALRQLPYGSHAIARASEPLPPRILEECMLAPEGDFEWPFAGHGLVRLKDLPGRRPQRAARPRIIELD